MMRLLSIVVAVFVTVFAAGSSACVHAPATITTPAGKAAFNADQVVLRLNELETAAIVANSQNGLSVDKTKVFVEFVVSADTILKTTPNGWLATLTSAWNVAKSKIGVSSNAAVTAAMGAVDVALASLGQ